MAATEARDIAGGPRELKGVPAYIPTSAGERLEAIGTAILRYGVVFLLVGIGSTKFFAFEAKAIQPLVAHSPLVGWLYPILGLQGVSNLFGLSEVIAGILIALRPFSAKLSATGSLAGVLTAVIFTFTLSMQDFLYSLVYVSISDQKPVPLGVATDLIRGDVYFWGSLMAGALFVGVPVAILYSFFLDHFIAGITGAAVK